MYGNRVTASNGGFAPPSQAPSYELKWPNTFTGELETVCDWHGVSPLQTGNIAQLFASVAPVVQLGVSPTAPSSPTGEELTPKNAPAAASVSNSARTSEERDSSKAAEPVSKAAIANEATTTTGVLATRPDGGMPGFPLHELWAAFRQPFGVPVRFDTHVSLSPLKGYDQEVYYTPQLSGFHFIVRPEAPRQPEDAAQSGREFSWFATDKPDMRRPLYDQMISLTEQPEYQFLTKAMNTDFAVYSWFAVLWLPLHVKNHSQSLSAGSFLCFYLVNPPVNVKGSNYTGLESVFRSDRFSTQKPIWELSPSLQANEVVDCVGPGRDDASATSKGASKVSTPAAENKPQASAAFPAAPAAPLDQATIEAFTRIRLPVFAIIPGRFRTDVWFKPVADSSRRTHWVGPLHLIVAAFQLLSWEAAHNPAWTAENQLADVPYMTRHERTLQEFIAHYGS
jgi:hypothetical protein